VRLATDNWAPVRLLLLAVVKSSPSGDHATDHTQLV
jgi:hypothetical protein